MEKFKAVITLDQATAEALKVDTISLYRFVDSNAVGLKMLNLMNGQIGIEANTVASFKKALEHFKGMLP